MPHVVLLGDSVFDNRAYVGTEPDVTTHLRQAAPDDWKVTLCAVDGSLVSGVGAQLRRIPDDATHLIVSAGGNDALSNADILGLPVASSVEVFMNFADRADALQRSYDRMLNELLATGVPTAVCTIYLPNFSKPNLQRIASTALSAFNDVILLQAFRRGLPVLDLRLVCDERDDYANEIEPSGKGGGKIAHGLLNILSSHDFSRRISTVYS